LALSALVSHSIQPGVLHQNIETVEERPSASAAADIGLGGVRDNSLLSATECSHQDVHVKTKRLSDLMHDYGGNWTKEGRAGTTAPRDRSFWQPGALHW
jgi:hypothetical protein